MEMWLLYLESVTWLSSTGQWFSSMNAMPLVSWVLGAGGQDDSQQKDCFLIFIARPTILLSVFVVFFFVYFAFSLSK